MLMVPVYGQYDFKLREVRISPHLDRIPVFPRKRILSSFFETLLALREALVPKVKYGSKPHAEMQQATGALAQGTFTHFPTAMVVAQSFSDDQEKDSSVAGRLVDFGSRLGAAW